jgi:hypothetical protein
MKNALYEMNLAWSMLAYICKKFRLQANCCYKHQLPFKNDFERLKQWSLKIRFYHNGKSGVYQPS